MKLWWIRAIAACLSLGPMLGGCCNPSRGVSGAASDAVAAVGDDAGREFQRLARGADELPDGSGRIPQVPEVVIPSQVDDCKLSVQQEAVNRVGPHVDGLMVGDARVVIKAAGSAQDLYEIGQAGTFTEAAQRTVIALGGDATLRYRIAGLAQDLSTAKGSGDAQTASVMTCEVV